MKIRRFIEIETNNGGEYGLIDLDAISNEEKEQIMQKIVDDALKRLGYIELKSNK